MAVILIYLLQIVAPQSNLNSPENVLYQKTKRTAQTQITQPPVIIYTDNYAAPTAFYSQYTPVTIKPPGGFDSDTPKQVAAQQVKTLLVNIINI